MSTVPKRLEGLRAAMRAHGLTHYLVPSADEHLDEYLPEWRRRREFLCGFTGSAGDLLVGLDDAWLFTDGRYHLQAELELRGSGIQLSKVGAPGHKTLLQHLRDEASSRGREMAFGCDPMVLSIGAADQVRSALNPRGAKFHLLSPNLVDPLWKGRPHPPQTPLVHVEPRWAGRATAEKLADVRAALQRAGANALLVVKLDQLAWLLNLRARDDVPYNPVFEGFGFVTEERLHVFLHGPERRIPPPARAAIQGLHCHEYEGLLPFLAALPAGTRALLDPSGATVGLQKALEANTNVDVILGPSPVEDLKARKNQAEQEAMRVANRRASAAKAAALSWLENEVASGRTVTERRFQDEIERLYAALPDYWGLSFDTIASAGPHGAIIHYKDADQTLLRPGDLFIIDSGCHVAGGTTDDTRTIVVGKATAEQRRLYTLVLQCHIAAASLRFPEGTPGTAVDAICRGPLWRAGLAYDHGTGHGVGSFLNVHEGPFALSEAARKPFAVTPLHAGMVTSIEPGYYRAGWGGIRLENLYLIVEAGTDDLGQKWLAFEPLTFVPFDERLIDRSLLSEDDCRWLEAYQRRVRLELAAEAPDVAAELPAPAGAG